AARLKGAEKFDHFPWDAPIESTELGPMVDSSDIIGYDYGLINITLIIKENFSEISSGGDNDVLSDVELVVS
ncbi:10272_t:CDS:2, partial [Gigaspora rosea]